MSSFPSHLRRDDSNPHPLMLRRALAGPLCQGFNEKGQKTLGLWLPRTAKQRATMYLGADTVECAKAIVDGLIIHRCAEGKRKAWSHLHISDTGQCVVQSQ